MIAQNVDASVIAMVILMIVISILPKISSTVIAVTAANVERRPICANAILNMMMTMTTPMKMEFYSDERTCD